MALHVLVMHLRVHLSSIVVMPPIYLISDGLPWGSKQWGKITLTNSGDGKIFNGAFSFPINVVSCHQVIAIQIGGPDSKASASVITGFGNNYANVRIEYPLTMSEGYAFILCVCS